MDQETNNAFEKLYDYLRAQMITKDEIDARFETLPTKADIHRLQSSVDGAGGYKGMSEELTVIGARTSRIEHWIIKAAARIGLEYKP